MTTPPPQSNGTSTQRHNEPPKRTIPASHSRPRELAPGNEEASSVLRLGEFDGVPTLTLSEARVLFNHVLARRQAGDGGEDGVVGGAGVGGGAGGAGGGSGSGGAGAGVIDGRIPRPEGEVVSKTMAYLDIFARFRHQDVVQNVEGMLKDHQRKDNLEDFERAQLGSLCCETYEEAKSLIPSIQDKISDSSLQEVLDELTKLRSFTE